MEEPKFHIQNEGTIPGQVVTERGIVNQYYYGVAPPSQQASTPEAIWTVPYERNALFTGREDVLTRLHDQLSTKNATALTQSHAISGLGGIGKTHIAIEFAYRYGSNYRYVLWVSASSRDALLADFIILADLFHLLQPEKDERYQTRLIALVKQWFVQHDQWLLILDNADNLNIIHEFLPTAGKGHILLTTRESVTYPISSITIDKMEEREGVVFLLRRAGLLPGETPLERIDQEYVTQAATIVQALGSLPLALDQAGAYMVETPCSLSAYLNRYQQRRQHLLGRRGRSSFQHPNPVTATMLLCFAQVSEQSALAADLLRYFAFLEPDSIPEDMVKGGAAELGPQLQAVATDESLLDEAIGELLRYSLIKRNSEQQTFSLHRLVQTVLKDEMPPDEQHMWAERVVRAINLVFPTIEITTWPQCQQYLPHAQICAELIEQEHLVFQEAAHLLNQMAFYLGDVALYAKAEPLYQRALAIREQALGPNHPDTASSLNNLANLYWRQGKYEEAEPLYQRALAIREQALGPNHPDTATACTTWLHSTTSRGNTRRRSRSTSVPWPSGSKR